MRIARHEARRPAPEFDPDSFRRRAWQRAGDRLRPFRPARDAGAAGAGRRRHRHRQERRAHPAAAQFGFKVYYGDGTRLDVLRAAGAAECTSCRGVRRRTARTRWRSWSSCASIFRSRRCMCAPMTASTPIDLLNAGAGLPAPRDGAVGAGIRPGGAGGLGRRAWKGRGGAGARCASETSSGSWSSAGQGKVLPPTVKTASAPDARAAVAAARPLPAALGRDADVVDTNQAAE